MRNFEKYILLTATTSQFRGYFYLPLPGEATALIEEPGQKVGTGCSGLIEPGQVMTGILLLPGTSSLTSVLVTNTGRGDKGISELLLFPKCSSSLVNDLHLWLVESETRERHKE